MRDREEIERQIHRLAEGDSNDEEIDTLLAIVTELLNDRDSLEGEMEDERNRYPE